MKRAPLQETWITIPDWERYEVSNFGRVRKKARLPSWPEYSYKGKIVEVIEAKILKPDRHGIILYFKGQSKSFPVAALVLNAFVGPPPPDKPLARHLDDDFTNNYVSNLAWGSYADNLEDSRWNGRRVPLDKWIAKMIAASKKRTPEQRKATGTKIAATRKANGGWKNLTPETRAKMRASRYAYLERSNSKHG